MRSRLPGWCAWPALGALLCASVLFHALSPFALPASDAEAEVAFARVAAAVHTIEPPTEIRVRTQPDAGRFLLTAGRPGPDEVDLVWTCAEAPTLRVCVDQLGAVSMIALDRALAAGEPPALDALRAQLDAFGVGGDGEVLAQRPLPSGGAAYTLDRGRHPSGDRASLRVEADALGVRAAMRDWEGRSAAHEAVDALVTRDANASFVVQIPGLIGLLIPPLLFVWLSVRRPRELFQPAACGIALVAVVLQVIREPAAPQAAAFAACAAWVGLAFERRRAQPPLADVVIAGTGWAAVVLVTSLAAQYAMSAAGAVGVVVASRAFELWAGGLEAGLVEELAFRAVLAGGLLQLARGDRRWVPVAIGVSAALFATLHVTDSNPRNPFWLRLIDTGAMGVVLGIAWWRSGLWAAVWAHASFDVLIDWPLGTRVGQVALLVFAAPALVVGLSDAWTRSRTRLTGYRVGQRAGGTSSAN